MKWNVLGKTAWIGRHIGKEPKKQWNGPYIGHGITSKWVVLDTNITNEHRKDLEKKNYRFNTLLNWHRNHHSFFISGKLIDQHEYWFFSDNW